MDEAATIGTIQQIYDGRLLPDMQARTFRSIDRLFPTREVPAGGPVRALPEGAQLGNIHFQSKGVVHDLFDYVALNRVSGLLVLKDGAIRFQTYELGNSEHSRWMSMSIAKSFTSTLIGAAIHDGCIGSLDDAVIDHLPQLAGSTYQGVSVRNVIQMASGVAWNEDYLNPDSDRRRMLLVQNRQQPGAVLAQLAALPRAAVPGTRWNYSTGETHVLGALLSAATGQPLASYLSQKIWVPFGMEAPASWWLESPGGLEIGGSGISATLRDYGRFGLFLLGGGWIGGSRILPDGWVAQATRPHLIGGQEVPYGYMFWPIPDPPGAPAAGAFEARGIFGQHIYVNPAEQVVIAVSSALPKPVDKASIKDHDFFAAVVHALRP